MCQQAVVVFVPCRESKVPGSRRSSNGERPDQFERGRTGHAEWQELCVSKLLYDFVVVSAAGGGAEAANRHFIVHVLTRPSPKHVSRTLTLLFFWHRRHVYVTATSYTVHLASHHAARHFHGFNVLPSTGAMLPIENTRSVVTRDGLRLSLYPGCTCQDPPRNAMFS